MTFSADDLDESNARQIEKRFSNGTTADARDYRTVPFHAAEFANAWAVHRGMVFGTNRLETFQNEFSTWLARRDQEIAVEARLSALRDADEALEGIDPIVLTVMEGLVDAAKEASDRIEREK